MFTGIIETLAKLEKIEKEGSNLHFTFASSIAPEFKVDQSVAHNGVCLTVVSKNGTSYKVTAIDETLKRTNLNSLKAGDLVNLERCMLANGRFDGHIVQGHVDTTAICSKIENKNGNVNRNKLPLDDIFTEPVLTVRYEGHGVKKGDQVFLNYRRYVRILQNMCTYITGVDNRQSPRNLGGTYFILSLTVS